MDTKKMGNVIDLTEVRVQNMLGDIDAAALDVARQLWAFGYRANSTDAMTEAVVQAEQICRERGYDEERVAAFGRFFGRTLFDHLRALEPVPMRR